MGFVEFSHAIKNQWVNPRVMKSTEGREFDGGELTITLGQV